MNGANFSNVVFDTNAFIYFLGGDERLIPFMDSTIYLSEFTEMELKGRFGITEKELKKLDEILEDFIVLPFNNAIKERAISVRHRDLPFVTADKDFKNIPSLNLILL